MHRDFIALGQRAHQLFLGARGCETGIIVAQRLPVGIGQDFSHLEHHVLVDGPGTALLQAQVVIVGMRLAFF